MDSSAIRFLWRIKDDDSYFTHLARGGELDLLRVGEEISLAIGQRIQMISLPSGRRMLAEVLWVASGAAKDVFLQIPEEWSDWDEAREMLRERVESEARKIKDSIVPVTFIRCRKA